MSRADKQNVLTLDNGIAVVEMFVDYSAHSKVG